MKTPISDLRQPTEEKHGSGSPLAIHHSPFANFPTRHSSLATHNPSPATSRRQAGMALVVTLSVIVLVTIAAMAFFTRATSNRTIEASRANQVLAGQLAETAQDYVIAQFLQEMTNNALALTTTNGTTVYQVTNAAGMVPERLLAQSSMTNDTNFANLVRQSAPGADTNASADSTATASPNGRHITADRWNAPRLNIGAGFTGESQLPNWIYVNRDGTTTATASSNAIGRFAYNVYETGGLLDANVAGYPSAVTGANLQAIKSALAGADLTALGISQSAIDDLVVFRTPQSGASASAYTNYVAGASRTGFLANVVTNGSGAGVTTNNFFVSRQDLIRYAETQNTGLTNALPYLTHATRASTAPSWVPVTHSNSLIDYTAQATNAASTNRFFPSVLVEAPFTRRDGSQAKAGEPLVKTRFPLSKLAWIGADGPVAPGTAATIQRDFGLQWDGANKRWNYVGHSGNTVQTSIKTLDQVATENREPNFFELLKAGILRGSLSGGTAINSMGAHLNPAYSRTSGDTINNNPLEDIHVIQIGANIVDQSDADNFPTAVRFGVSPVAMDFYGIEDLPYVSRGYFTYFRLPTGTVIDPATGLTQPSYRPFVRGWLRFDLWNPHRQTSSSPSGDIRLVIEPNGNTLRLQATGLQAVPVADGGSGSTPPANSTPQLSTTKTNTASFTAASFRNNTSFTGAAALNAASYSGSTHPGGFVIPPFSGFWLGDLYLPHIVNTATNPLATPNGVGVNCANARINLELASYDVSATSPPDISQNPELRLEINTPSGWRIYQKICNFTPRIANTIRGGWFNPVADMDVRTANTNAPDSNARAVMVGGFAWAFLDPRTQRFGFPNLESGYDSRTNANDTSTVPMKLDSKDLVWGAGIPSDDLINGNTNCLFDPSYNFMVSGNKQATHVSPEALGFLRYKSFAANDVTFGSLTPDSDGSAPHAFLSNTSYRDTDRVQRRGDNSPTGSYDFYTDDTARPVVLNRPFLTVGELGVVFRDTPWRTLDLTSSRSADGGLADIFSVTEQATGSAAGKININTAPEPVLAAVFSQPAADAAPEPESLDPAKAQSLKAAFLDQRAIGKFLSVANALSDTGKTFENSAALVEASGTGSFNGADVLVKTRRDALARAFADVADVRTWSFLADIISQSGSFTGGTFRETSQDRSWVSFSLDRHAGKLTAISNEKVTD